MNEIPVSCLNGSELLCAAQSVYSIISTVPHQAGSVIVQLGKLLGTDISRLSRALEQQRSSTFTNRIESVDSQFDKSFMMLRNYLVLMSKQDRQPEAAQAATRLINVIRSVDWYINRRSYVQELAGSSALMDLFSSEENTAAIQACDASQWYISFVKAAEQIRTIFDSRIAYDAPNSVDCPDLKNAKVDTQLHIDQIYSYCTMLENLDPVTWGPLAARLDHVAVSIAPAVHS